MSTGFEPSKSRKSTYFVHFPAVSACFIDSLMPDLAVTGVRMPRVNLRSKILDFFETG